MWGAAQSKGQPNDRDQILKEKIKYLPPLSHCAILGLLWRPCGISISNTHWMLSSCVCYKHDDDILCSTQWKWARAKCWSTTGCTYMCENIICDSKCNAVEHLWCVLPACVSNWTEWRKRLQCLVFSNTWFLRSLMQFHSTQHSLVFSIIIMAFPFFLICILWDV